MEAEFLDMMTQTVTVKPKTAFGAYGTAVRGAPVDYPCHVSIKAGEAPTRAGGVVTTTGTAWLAGHFPELDTADAAEVPGLGLTAIVAVQHVFDEVGPHHTVLYFGAA
ncbi:head-to-tail stopper [Arthrobacter phage Waltz]|nr:head-to-tail stopper [Arthrobacter phage Waltz]